MAYINQAPREFAKQSAAFKKAHPSLDSLPSSEYTMQPATTSETQVPWEDQNMYLLPQSTGFSVMHAKRGFFVSFLLHGIPVADEAATGVGLTQPKFDCYWLNAFKYGYTEPSMREFHGNLNPLDMITPQMVNFGNPTAGNVVIA